MILFPVYSSLFTQTRANEKSRILEAGCGLGTHAYLFSRCYSKPDTALFICDFAPQMLKGACNQFTSADSHMVNDPQNVFFQEAFEMKEPINVEEKVKTCMGDKKGALVHASIQDSQKLNFNDNSFEAYLSNLVLHIVPDPQAQINEAFRVLKSGCFAAFSIPGKYINAFDIIKEVMNSAGVQDALDQFMFLGRNPDKLKEMFKNAGFVDLQMWTAVHHNGYYTGEEVYNFYSQAPPVAAIQKQDQEKKDQIRNAAVKIMNERFEVQGKSPRDFELTVIVARKP